jgi:hypothetical protein
MAAKFERNMLSVAPLALGKPASGLARIGIILDNWLETAYQAQWDNGAQTRGVAVVKAIASPSGCTQPAGTD